MSGEAEWDALLAARDWGRLTPLITGDVDLAGRARRMMWVRRTIDAGGGFVLVLAYFRDLWGIGRALDVSGPGDMRLAAGVMVLYGVALIRIDGCRCKDTSAPGHQMTQFNLQTAEAVEFLKNLPRDQKRRLIDRAMTLERTTAPMRQDDDRLCRGGVSEYLAAFEGGGEPQEVPSPPGQPGRRFVVASPPGWTPTLLPPADCAAAMTAARDGLPATLAWLIDLDAAPPH